MVSVTTVSKWGNVLGIRLPQRFTKQMGIKEGEKVSIVKEGKGMYISRHPIFTMSLEDLVNNINYKDLTSYFPETNGEAFSIPVGREVW